MYYKIKLHDEKNSPICNNCDNKGFNFQSRTFPGNRRITNSVVDPELFEQLDPDPERVRY